MEEQAMMLILGAGNANGLAFSALRAAKNKNFDEARSLIKQASQKCLEAHNIQTQLIQKEANGEKIAINLLMVHAQDHLMNVILTIDLVEELIEIFDEYSKADAIHS